VADVGVALARLRGIEPTALAAATSANFEHLFGIPEDENVL
jgi:Tat protein secretion system quality control protein TatD with DNase activity